MKSEKGRRETTQTRRMSSYLRSFHSLTLFNTMCIRSFVRPYVCTRRLSTCRRKVSRTRRVEGAEYPDGASSDRSGLSWLVSCSIGPRFYYKKPIYIKIAAVSWHNSNSRTAFV